jgi:hypothetical protein
MEKAMADASETIRTIDLGYEQMWVFDGGRDARVRVLYGAAWLTEEGEPGDAIARAGDEVALHGGRAVIEAIGPARVQIVSVRPGVLRRAGRWLQQAARRARQQAGRLQLGAVAAEPNS